MLSIETVRSEDIKDYLIVDGIRVEPDWVWFSRTSDQIAVGISDAEVAKRLSSYTFKQLMDKFSSIDLLCDVDLPESYYLSVRFDLPKDTRSTRVEFKFFIQVINYTQPWSIADFAEKLQELAGSQPQVGLEYFESDPDTLTNGFGLMFEVDDLEVVVDQVVSHRLPVVEELTNRAFSELKAGVAKDSLVTMFKFPSHVATACEQYLLYFVQFLLDLGIEARATIKHEAGSVLFSVTPKDGPEALDRIRQALQVYLAIPSAGDFSHVSPQYSDISVRQLEANVYHLRSQLALSTALLQAKEAQVEALQLSLYQYRQLLAGSVILNRPMGQPLSSTADKGEVVLDGLVEIRPVELSGVSVNLPEIFRRLKRKVLGR